MTTEQNEDKIKALIEELRDSPDFAHLPFPKDWYKKFNIPVPKPHSFKEFLDSGYWFKHHFDEKVERVKIDVAPGGIRPVLPAPEIPVEVITRQIDDDSQLEKPSESGDSTVSNDSEPLQK